MCEDVGWTAHRGVGGNAPRARDGVTNGQLGPAITRMALAAWPSALSRLPLSCAGCRPRASRLHTCHCCSRLPPTPPSSGSPAVFQLPCVDRPESAVSQSRDTAVVVEELFAHAERFVLVSSYVVQKGRSCSGRWLSAWSPVRDCMCSCFSTLAANGGTPVTSPSCSASSVQSCLAQWPGWRRPEVFYDPRTLSADAAFRAAWHAKCVIADDDCSSHPPTSPNGRNSAMLKQECSFAIVISRVS